MRAASPWSRRRRALIGAALAFVAIAVTELLADPYSRTVVLVCLPVALIGLSHGRRAGAVAAVVGTGVVVLTDLAGGDPGGWTGYGSDVVAFFLLGFGLGWFSEHVQDVTYRMSSALDSMLDAVVVAAAVRDAGGWPVDFRVLYANAGAAAALGRSPKVVVGRRWSELWPRGFPPELSSALAAVVEGGQLLELTDYALHVDGSGAAASTVVDLRASPFEDGLIVAWRDVSARSEHARAMAASQAQFVAAFEHAPVGMVLVDPQRRILRANQAFAAIVGRALSDLPGSPLDALVDPRNVETARSEFARLTSGESRTGQFESRMLTADGTSRWVSVTAALVTHASGAYVIEHVEDVHERRSFEDRLQYQADHDSLTGLLNRRRFAEELEHQLELDRRYGGGSAVVLLDLDHFKYINDTLGHQVGDRLIQAIADKLRLRVRGSDVVCRMGGDEFAVLLAGADADRAQRVTETLLDGIRSTHLEQLGQRVRSTGSAGIAVVEAGAAAADDVLANADLAMYGAKDAGRDTLLLFDPHGPHSAQAGSRFRWIERVRVALDQDLLTLLAQPILDLRSGRITGCELLVRMLDGDRLVAPDLWLPVAERHGMAVPVDRFVIRHGIGLAAAQRRPPGFRWEINLSAASLVDPGIPELISDQLTRTGVRPDSLVFEITETAAITNFDAAATLATHLTELGCHFALDDFGAGYGSFYYLKHLPFEYLKIDGEFIRQLTSNDTDGVIVEAIVGAARKLGKQTIAEYVGDAATVERLRVLQVDHAQGYFIGRPVDPSGAAAVPAPRVSG